MSNKVSERAIKPSEKQSGKGKSITLLSILSFVLAFLIVMTFISFPVGIHNYNGVLGAMDLDYDLAGGTAYTLTIADDNLEEVENVDEVVNVLRYRMSELGYQVFSVKALKSTETGVDDYEIRIEAKTTTSIEQDISVATAYGKVVIYGGTSENPTTEILTENKAIADCRYTGSYVGSDNKTYYNVAIVFTDYAYNELMKEIDNATASDSNYYIQINLGDTVLVSGSSAITKSIFSNKTIGIQTNSEATARQTALQIRTGGLAYKYDVSDGVEITSPYGANVALMSVLTVVAIVVLAIAGYILKFKGAGIIPAMSLLSFIVLETLMLIAFPGITVSLGSVLGIIVSTVVVTAMLYYVADKTDREFKYSQKTVKAAVKKALKDTMMPSISVCGISAVLGLLLLAFTAGVVKGFAITLVIGAAIGAITLLAFNRMYANLIVSACSANENFLNLKREEM